MPNIRDYPDWARQGEAEAAATRDLSSRRAVRARLPSEPWMPMYRGGLAVGEVQGHPGRARGQPGGDDLGPLVLVAAVAVDHHQPVGVGDRTGPDQRAASGAEVDQPEDDQRAALEPVNLARVSSSKVNHADRDHGDQRERSPRCRRRGPRAAARCAAGRAAGRRASESAGMDVREQDPPRTELVELVHQPLGAVARAPSRAPRPSPRDGAGRWSGPRCRGSARPPRSTFACSMS